MAVITVTNANNSGAGSLRAAIEQANGTAEADSIIFDASLSGQTIRLFNFDPATGLPELGGLQNGTLRVTASSLSIDGDIDGDGQGDITISGDGDADGFASAQDVQILNVDNTVAAFALNGVSLYGGYGRSAPDAPGAPVVARDGGIAVSALASFAGTTTVTNLFIGPGEARAENGIIEGSGGGAATVVVSGTSRFENVLFTNVRAYSGDGAGTGAAGAAVAGIINTGDLTVSEVGFTGGYALAGAGAGSTGAIVGILNSGTLRGPGGAGPTLFFGEEGGAYGNLAVAPGAGDLSLVGAYDFNGGSTVGALVIGFAGDSGGDALDVSTTGGARLVHGFFGDDTIRGSGESDTLLGGDGADRLLGGGGDDALTGGAGGDVIRGQGGNDRGFGGTGDDKVVGNAGNDTLRGQLGDDTLVGGGGNDRLIGAAGNDVIRGGGGDDRVVGGGGDDTLTGGAGNDILIGRAGADVFAFTQGSGDDVLRGFQQGTDRLDFTFLDGIGDLTIAQQGGATLITHAGGTVLLTGQQAADFDETDFLF